MEYEQIKRLIDDMGDSKLTMLDIEFPDGIKIKMEKKSENNETVITTEMKTKEIVNDNEEKKVKVNDQIEDGNIVKSPMVGTFYMKPSPNSTPYVEIGSNVNKGDVLCIIEAMKLMNEIESEYTGKVIEVFVKDGEPVEYGKPLFRIK